LRVPSSAYCVLGVTMCDLFPKPELDFVYGMAKASLRTGVFSFIRHTPRASEGSAEWRCAQLLHRSMKTMLHESGHLFGLKHCSTSYCLMRGCICDSECAESQQTQPNHLHLCPECFQKLQWNVGFDVTRRCRNLLAIYQEYEGHELFARDCDFLRKQLQDLEAPANALPYGTCRSIGGRAARSSSAPPPLELALAHGTSSHAATRTQRRHANARRDSPRSKLQRTSSINRGATLRNSPRQASLAARDTEKEVGKGQPQVRPDSRSNGIRSTVSCGSEASQGGVAGSRSQPRLMARRRGPFRHASLPQCVGPYSEQIFVC